MYASEADKTKTDGQAESAPALDRIRFWNDYESTFTYYRFPGA